MPKRKNKLKKLQVGQLKTNCYLFAGAIIDPGDDFDYIYQTILDLDFQPKTIIATHGHFDHLLAVNELKSAFNIPFYLPKKDEVMLAWYRKSCKYYLGFDPGLPPQVDKFLTLQGPSLHGTEVIPTPGHTPGGICLYSQKDNVLFSGDTIFAGGAVGRTDFPYCNRQDLEKSIKNLLKLPDETIVYPGHGEETTIGGFKQLYKNHAY